MYNYSEFWTKERLALKFAPFVIIPVPLIDIAETCAKHMAVSSIIIAQNMASWLV